MCYVFVLLSKSGGASDFFFFFCHSQNIHRLTNVTDIMQIVLRTS